MSKIADFETCPLCGRPFGEKVEWHHLVPKSKGGRNMVPLHPICHRKIHTIFSDTELARRLSSIEALSAEPDIIDFVAWVGSKPPDFYRRTEPRKGRR